MSCGVGEFAQITQAGHAVNAEICFPRWPCPTFAASFGTCASHSHRSARTEAQDRELWFAAWLRLLGFVVSCGVIVLLANKTRIARSLK